MRSLLRQFVYLVVDGRRPGTFDLHRINMSRFFRSPLMGTTLVEARLPRPKMTFYAPSSEDNISSLQFLLLDRNKLLATDQMGHAAIYDAGMNALRTAPPLSRPKYSPISVAVGHKHYVLDCSGDKDNCFEALVYEGGETSCGVYHDWRYHSLPSTPYRPGDIDAYAVVGGSDVWVSTEAEGTYSFNTVRGAWSKKGEWSLPFCGLAEYVPEYKLWFGISKKEDRNLFCAFDLAAATSRRRCTAPVPRNVWQDLLPRKGWLPVTSSLVHLGSGRFCIARFFYDEEQIEAQADDDPWKMFAVFAAVEVRPCGEAGKGLEMVRYRSECYSLRDGSLNQWVL
ncbi:hypothetical protein HU200_025797 [Digitaria exilis]|uniref:Uncharacterized protein n=1 Tax=Digitaria exilis TaxID=1010633 RepID=A0A835BZ73_9POAL|nr:hypothetical protein HU200_025797 [Digitaria exilis]